MPASKSCQHGCRLLVVKMICWRSSVSGRKLSAASHFITRFQVPKVSQDLKQYHHHTVFPGNTLRVVLFKLFMQRFKVEVINFLKSLDLLHLENKMPLLCYFVTVIQIFTDLILWGVFYVPHRYSMLEILHLLVNPVHTFLSVPLEMNIYRLFESAPEPSDTRPPHSCWSPSVQKEPERRKQDTIHHHEPNHYSCWSVTFRARE